MNLYGRKSKYDFWFFWKCILENEIVYLCFSAVVLILTSRLLICLVEKQNNEVNIWSQHRRRKKWMCLFKVFWSRPGQRANLYPYMGIFLLCALLIANASFNSGTAKLHELRPSSAAFSSVLKPQPSF